jgi:uncharacterized protein YjbJ (UPF0337 family)
MLQHTRELLPMRAPPRHAATAVAARDIFAANAGNTPPSDEIAETAKEVKGSVNEAITKVAGDAKSQADGKAERVAGSRCRSTSKNKSSAGILRRARLLPCPRDRFAAVTL